MFVRNFVIGSCVLSVLCGLSRFSCAQNIPQQFEKPLPKIVQMSQAEFEGQTTSVQEKLSSDASWAYEIRIPKGWNKDESQVKGDFLTAQDLASEIARFYSPPRAPERSRIEVKSMATAYDMTAKDWFSQYFIAQGYNFQGISVEDDRHAEALYVLIERSQSYVVRGRVYMNGKNMLFAQYFVPIEQWNAEKSLQAGVVRSFKMIGKTGAPPEDKDMKTYKFLDIAELRYPALWDLRASPIRNAERIKMQLLRFDRDAQIDERKEARKLKGQVDVEMVSAFVSDTLENEIARFKKTLGEGGLVLGAEIENPKDFILNPLFDFADTHVYRAQGQKGKTIAYEVWLTALSIGDYYYFVSLLTPAREGDYFLWAQNKQSYKAIVDSIKLRAGAPENHE